MNKLGFFLVPALLAVVARGEIVIYPRGDEKIHDLGADKATSSIIFTCKAINKLTDDAQLKWFDNNDREITAVQGRVFIQRNLNSLGLLFVNPNEEDGGVYTCKGMVDGVEQQASKKLQIYKGIKVLSDKKQYIINGTDDKVWCQISSSPDSELLISWYKVTTDDKGEASWVPLLNQESDKHYVYKPEKITTEDPAYLEIRNVSLSDEYTYLCNVHDLQFGKSVDHFINVVVTVPPRLTQGLTAHPTEPEEGHRLELSCKAEGIPPPHYTLTKYSDASRLDGEVVLENSTTGLHIVDNVKRGDEGLYECMAVNEGGSENVSVEVNVRVPPTIEDPMNLTLGEGENVRLACVAIGDPAPVLSWQQKDSPLPYHPQDIEGGQKVYVEEEQEEQELDQVSRVFRRTLYLVIPSVEPTQAAQYECDAHNSVGMTKHTFYVDVTYKPIFGDEVDSHFYGWVGSNTNLTCMASGNPTPEISWYKENMQLKKDEVYDIAMEETTDPHQAISYLIPHVDETNQATVFGTYRCEATNDLGKNEVELAYQLAVVPEEPEVTLLKEYPTAFKLQLQRPLQEGGQPVTAFIMSYARADEDESEAVRTMEVPLKAAEDSTKVELNDLTPNTEYLINVTAVNNVGNGLPTNLTATTADYSKPEKVRIISSRQGKEHTSYTLRWNVPMTGGAEISKYQVEYAVAEKVNTSSDPWQATRVSSNSITLNVDGEDNTNVKIGKLTRNTFYQVKIKAINRIGSSEVSTFVFKTSMGVSEAQTGSGSSVAISAGVLFLVTMVTASLHAQY